MILDQQFSSFLSIRYLSYGLAQPRCFSRVKDSESHKAVSSARRFSYEEDSTVHRFDVLGCEPAHANREGADLEKWRGAPRNVRDDFWRKNLLSRVWGRSSNGRLAARRRTAFGGM